MIVHCLAIYRAYIHIRLNDESYDDVDGVLCRYVNTVVDTGCDSIVSTTLKDTAVYSTTDLELCYGDSALFGGVMYGVYVDTLQSIWL